MKTETKKMTILNRAQRAKLIYLLRAHLAHETVAIDRSEANLWRPNFKEIAPVMRKRIADRKKAVRAANYFLSDYERFYDSY
ncbi:MAG: hypothetical protein ACTHMM_13455 [Agriterribacter sp.]